MKKFLCILLGVMFVFALTSCNKPAAVQAPENTQIPENTQVPESTQESDSKEKPEVVVFTDPVLEAEVRKAMNKPEGDITIAEVEAVTKLEMSTDWKPDAPDDTKINDISDLKYFKNLELLDLQFHAITDISPLAQLTKIHSLGLGGNRISDISVLTNLKELRFLSIFSCSAADYSPLKELTYLQTLFISWSTIEDLSVLSDLKDLTQLYIDNTQVSDLKPIAGLNLKSLRLEGSKVTDYSPIAAIYPNLNEKDFEIN